MADIHFPSSGGRALEALGDNLFLTSARSGRLVAPGNLWLEDTLLQALPPLYMASVLCQPLALLFF
jgi:hypothetical protein